MSLVVRGLAVALLLVAAPGAWASPVRSPTLARQALEARIDRPVESEPAPAAEPGRLPTPELREQLIGLLPGETLEEVARSLASRKIQLRVNSERALVLVRIPLE